MIAETERDVVMGSTTTQITEVMEGTVEIVVHYSNFQSEKYLFQKNKFYEKSNRSDFDL